MALLALLDRTPSHGFALKRRYDDLLGHDRELRFGQVYATLARLERDGCARYVVTDVTKDGTLTGPNLELLRQVCAQTDKPVVASGGVSSLQDLRDIATLTSLGVEGSIVGKALYAGAFTLPEALAAVREI